MGANLAYLTNTYDPHTGALTDQLVTRATAPVKVDEQNYTRDLAGNTTKQVTTRLGATAASETQCYQYDELVRLTQAWTATDDCSAAPTASSHAQVGDLLAGGTAYWTSWDFDALGQRQQQVEHSTIGGSDTTTSYAYDYNGNDTVQPHALASTQASGASTAATSYTYDKTGNTTGRTTLASGNQTLNWNNAGQLTQVSGGKSGTTSYIYDADGNVLLQTDPTSTTLYLPGEQLTLTGTTTTGVRYLPLPGGGTAVRTGTGTNYKFTISDPHGTSSLYLDSTAQTPTWRQFTPYGGPRGATASWIDNRGFLNAPTTPTPASPNSAPANTTPPSAASSASTPSSKPPTTNNSPATPTPPATPSPTATPAACAQAPTAPPATAPPASTPHRATRPASTQQCATTPAQAAPPPTPLPPKAEPRTAEAEAEAEATLTGAAPTTTKADSAASSPDSATNSLKWARGSSTKLSATSAQSGTASAEKAGGTAPT
ncbi:hypothetical protein L1856_05810 [Streptomyces sp. Tue 6430]|nr:hypothetical protein [Streptomyces sp. Tue 6430]